MKILYFADAQTFHLLRWCRQFKKYGHDVVVVTMNSDVLGGYSESGIEIICLPRNPSLSFLAKLLLSPLYFLKLLLVFNKIKPDIVHTFDCGSYSWLGSILPHKKLVVSPIGNDILIYAKNSSLYRFFVKYALHKADLIQVDGLGMRNEIKLLCNNHDKIKLVLYGTDVDKFKTSYQPKNSFKNIRPCIVCTRRLDPVHNVGIFLHAVNEVIIEHPDLLVLIAGWGPEEIFLRNLAESLGLSKCIQFLGKIDEAAMINLLDNADVYVVTSLSESGIAASTAEAMSMSLPIVTTNIGDIEIWCTNLDNIRLTRDNDSHDTAVSILKYLNDHLHRWRSGQCNRELILQRNNIQIEMNKMNELYKSLV